MHTAPELRCFTFFSLILFTWLYGDIEMMIFGMLTGVLTAEFMIKFLERILHPLMRISTHTDLMNFMALTDVSSLVPCAVFL